MRAPRPAVLALLVLLGPGCATFAAKAAFSRGQKAEDRGDLKMAIASYTEATRKAPDNLAYRDRLSAIRREAAAIEVRRAEAAEASGDFSTAAERWAAAAAIEPDQPSHAAREALAELSAKNADPVQVYAAVQRVATVAPNDPNVQARLRAAKKGALQYHLRLAGMFTQARSWSQAYAAYEAVEQIAPNHPALAGALYRQAKVGHLEAEGDAKLAAGDAIAAYAAYEAAVKLRPSSALKRKLRRAQRGAGPLIEQMRQAESLMGIGRVEDAAELFSGLVTRKDAPAPLRAQAAEARAKSATLRAERATAYAKRNLVDQAVTELDKAVDHTDGPDAALTALGAAVEALEANRPGQADAQVRAAEAAAPDLAATRAARAVTGAKAGRLFARAQALASRDPAEALTLVSRLSAFEATLPGYARTKKGLVKRAFGTLLDRAAGDAEAGRFGSATERLATARSIARPPASLARHLDAGAGALSAQDWARARAAYAAAARAEPRSRLAKAGLAVAERAHLFALRREAADAREVEDGVRAAAAYREILGLAPEDAEAQSGLAALQAELLTSALDSARAHAEADRHGAAYVYFARVLDLDPSHAEAQAGATKAMNALGLGAGPEAWVPPLGRGPALGERCRGVERAVRDRTALYLTKTPGLPARFLEAEQAEAVDATKRAAPAVALSGRVTECAPSETGGNLSVQVSLQLGERVLFEEPFSATFDPKSVPKDELEDGLDARRVVLSLVGDVAKAVSARVKEADLGAWRVMEARAHMKKGDAEQAARVYASLDSAQDSLTTEERGTLEALERYLNNRYR